MMRSSFRSTPIHGVTMASVITVLMALGTIPAVAAAAERPNFSGLWAKTTRHEVEIEQMAPMTPEGKRLWAINKAGIEASDSSIHKGLACMPPGFPRNALAEHPLGFFHSDKTLAITGEPIVGIRMIHIDAAHVAGLPPQIHGDAVGHWEGDTLVVDTVNIYDGTFTDGEGIPHSSALHAVQRFRLINGGQNLEETLEIDDPIIYTKPWSATFQFERTRWRPPEKFCNEMRNEP